TPKPSPDGIIKMCKTLKMKPRNAVYIGDTEADIIAAKNAGCIPVGVMSGGSERRVLRDLGAAYTFKNVTEFALWLRDNELVTNNHANNHTQK
ncbi:MAG: HAD-IA family hydrolase, partial [Candidatus Micrarchaeia archaeon]